MKCINRGYYQAGVIIFITLVFGTGIVCAPAQCGFSVSTPYKASFFDGKILSGRTVIVGPLLTKNGADSTGLLKESFKIEKIRKSRNDLTCVSFAGSAEKIRGAFGDTLLQNFLKDLYNSDIPAVQTTDSIWELISEDYILITRLKTAHSIRTFSRDVRKRIHIEGELWDCKKAEVVFRVSVDGICLTEKIRDDQFVLNGILTIYRELPAPSPSYDTQEW